MPIRFGGGGGGGRGFRLGPEQNRFTGTSKELAEAARDAYAADLANLDWVEQYRDGAPRLLLMLEDTDDHTIFLQTFRESTPSYASVFEDTYDGNELIAKPDTALIGSESGGRRYYTFGGIAVADYADATNIVTPANAARALRDPWIIDNDGTKIEIAGDLSVQAERTRATVWARTFRGPDGTEYSLPVKPLPTRTTPFIRTDAGEALILRIPEGGGTNAYNRIQALLAIWNEQARGSLPWEADFSDSSGALRNFTILNIEYGVIPTNYHYYEVTLDNAAGTNVATGNIVGTWDLTGLFPSSWQVRIDIGEATGTAPADIASADWDLEDRDYAHSWRDVGGGGGSDRGFRRGPEQYLFSAASREAAIAARDAYARDPANADWLSEYRNGQPLLMVLLEDTEESTIHLQTFHESVTTYTSVFGVEYGSITLPAKPSAQDLGGYDEAPHRGYHYPAGSRADAVAVIDTANAARAAEDAWYVRTAADTRVRAFADFRLHIVRSLQSIWGQTYFDLAGTSHTIPAASTSSVSPSVSRASDGVLTLEIPEANDAAASTRIDTVVARFAAADGTKQWQADFTDASTPTGIDRSQLIRSITKTRTGAGATQRYNYSVDLGINAAIAVGNVTSLEIRGFFPDRYDVRIPIGASTGTAPASITAANWDIQDHDLTHNWRDVGAVTGSMLDTGDIDARINALVEAYARVGGTADLPISRLADDSITEAKLAPAVVAKLDASDMEIVRSSTTYTAAETAALDTKILYVVADSNATITLSRPTGTADRTVRIIAAGGGGGTADVTVTATPDAARAAAVVLRAAGEEVVGVYDVSTNRWEFHPVRAQYQVRTSTSFSTFQMLQLDGLRLVCRNAAAATLTFRPPPTAENVDLGFEVINLAGNSAGTVTLTTTDAANRSETLTLQQGETARVVYRASTAMFSWFTTSVSLAFSDISGEIALTQIPNSIARDTEVAAAVEDLVDSAPSSRDTLAKIATALATVEGRNNIKNITFSGNQATITFLDDTEGTRSIAGATVGSPANTRDLLERVLFSTLENVDADPWVALTPKLGSVRSIDQATAAETGTALAIVTQVDAADVTAKRLRIAAGLYLLVWEGQVDGDEDRAGPVMRVVNAGDSTVYGVSTYAYIRNEETVEDVRLICPVVMPTGTTNVQIQLRNAPSTIVSPGQGQFDVADESKLRIYRWGSSATGGGASAFSELTGQIADSQVPDSFTRDSEVPGLANVPALADNADVDAETDDSDYVSVAKVFRAIARKVANATETARGIIEIANNAEARTGTDDTKAVTPLLLKREIDHYLGQTADDNDVYFGGLAADPTTEAQVTALQSADIPTNGEQTLVVARTWTGANRHFYIAQLEADDDITHFEIDGLASTGWTRGTFTDGSQTYEYWKSQYAWGSATAQGTRIGIRR